MLHTLRDRIRPHFSFHQHAQMRRKVSNETPCHPAGVIWEITLQHTRRVLAEQFPTSCAPGRRHVREQDAVARMARGEGLDDGRRGARFPDRHGVDPDRFVAVEVEADRQHAHALREAADVLAVPERLIGEPRGQDDRQHDDGGRVEQVHAPEFYC